MTSSGAEGSEVRLFVYGTLLSGERWHAKLGAARLVRARRTAPRYELRDLGAYPALVEGGAQSVVGEVYALPAYALDALDRFEGPLYARAPIELDDGEVVQAYVADRGALGARAVIPSGSWRSSPEE